MYLGARFEIGNRGENEAAIALLLVQKYKLLHLLHLLLSSEKKFKSSKNNEAIFILKKKNYLGVGGLTIQLVAYRIKSNIYKICR